MSVQSAVIPDAGSMVRHAALTVHALAESDRKWVLAQLPKAERDRLARLLNELRTLGIPAQQNMLDEALQPTPANMALKKSALPTTDSEPSDDRFAQQQNALNRLDASVVSRALQNEPLPLIAQLLSIRAWAWRAAVLDQLGSPRRRRVEEILGDIRRQLGTCAPEGLHRHLLEALYHRLVSDTPIARREGGIPRRTPAQLAPGTAALRMSWPVPFARWLSRRRTAKKTA